MNETMTADMAALKNVEDADPFAANMSGLHKFRMSVLQITKMLETGRTGGALWVMAVSNLEDSAHPLISSDFTGTVRRVYFAVREAMKAAR